MLVVIRFIIQIRVRSIQMSGPLLIRVQVGNSSELVIPTVGRYRYCIFVRAHDGANFMDQSIVQRMSCTVHQDEKDDKGDDQECMRVRSVLPPYEVSGTSPEEFPSMVTIKLDGKSYKFTYDVTLSRGKSSQFITETIYLSRSSPAFYSNAKRFGADSVVRSNEAEMLCLPGLTRSSSLDSLNVDDPTEKRRRIDRQENVFPICSLPAEIIMLIFDRLHSIQERWKMRLNKKLQMFEKLGRPVIPSLTITSSRDVLDDGTTLRSPLNPSHDYGNAGVAFVKRLERLCLYSIHTLRLSFVSESNDQAYRRPYANFRRDVYRAIGMMTADTVVCDNAYITSGDFQWVVNAKKRFFMDVEFRTMYSKGYLRVIKKMFNEGIELQCLAMPVGRNGFAFDYLWSHIQSDLQLGEHVQWTPDELSMRVVLRSGKTFTLSFTRYAMQMMPNLAPSHLFVKVE